MLQLPLTAAAVVTDALGREWDPKLHPRDRKGKFIRTFSLIRSFLGSADTPWAVGEVDQIKDDGFIRMKVTKVTDPSNNHYIGNHVDLDPGTVESLNEKASLSKVDVNDGDTFKLYNFEESSMADFFSAAGLTTDKGTGDAANAAKAANLFNSGKGNQVGPIARYHLALYAADTSPDDDTYKSFLEDLDVPPDVIDDTPDGFSGLQWLANKVNETKSPSQSDTASSEHWDEVAPIHEGAVRQLKFKNGKTQLAFLGDGSFDLIDADGDIENVPAGNPKAVLQSGYDLEKNNSVGLKDVAKDLIANPEIESSFKMGGKDAPPAADAAVPNEGPGDPLDSLDTLTSNKFEILQDSGANGDGFMYNPGGPSLWGKYGAAGVMARHVDENGVERFLLVQRGPALDGGNKGKWQLPGGALNSKENDYQGAARELMEELAPPDHFLPSLQHVGDVNFEHKSGWHYNNIAADAPEQFEPHVDGHETGDAGWFTKEEVAQLNLHPALANNLDNIYAQFPEPKKPGVNDDLWAKPGAKFTGPDPVAAKLNDFGVEGTLAPEEKSALTFYGAPSGYKLVNPFLHHDKHVFDTSVMKYRPATPSEITKAEKTIKDLDSAFEKGKPLDHPVLVYRRSGLDQFSDEDMTGETLSNLAYTSTATQIASHGYGYETKPVLWQITLPAGTKALQGNDFENEVLLPRNAKFDITSDTTDETGLRHIEMTYHTADGSDTDAELPVEEDEKSKPEKKADLTPEQLEYLDEYISASEDLNDTLRGIADGVEYGGSLKKEVDTLDGMMTPVPPGMKLYRGMAPKDYDDDGDYENFVSSIVPGAKISDKAYMSTSTNKALAQSFMNNPDAGDGTKMLFEIDAPEGTVGIDVDATSLSNNENEILLPRNTVMEVESIKTLPDGTQLVKAKIVLGDENGSTQEESSEPEVSGTPAVEAESSDGDLPEEFEATATYELDFDLTEVANPDEVFDILEAHNIEVIDSESDPPDPSVGYEGYNRHRVRGTGNDLQDAWLELGGDMDQFAGKLEDPLPDDEPVGIKTSAEDPWKNPKAGQDFRAGEDGKPIYVGDKVKASKDGLEGVVIGFEHPDIGGVKIKGDDGKVRARKAYKVISLEDHTAPQPTPTPEPEPTPEPAKPKPHTPQTTTFGYDTEGGLNLPEAASSWADTALEGDEFHFDTDYAGSFKLVHNGDTTQLVDTDTDTTIEAWKNVDGDPNKSFIDKIETLFDEGPEELDDNELLPLEGDTDEDKYPWHADVTAYEDLKSDFDNGLVSVVDAKAKASSLAKSILLQMEDVDFLDTAYTDGDDKIAEITHWKNSLSEPFKEADDAPDGGKMFDPPEDPAAILDGTPIGEYFLGDPTKLDNILATIEYDGDVDGADIHSLFLGTSDANDAPEVAYVAIEVADYLDSEGHLDDGDMENVYDALGIPSSFYAVNTPWQVQAAIANTKSFKTEETQTPDAPEIEPDTEAVAPFAVKYADEELADWEKELLGIGKMGSTTTMNKIDFIKVLRDYSKNPGTKVGSHIDIDDGKYRFGLELDKSGEKVWVLRDGENNAILDAFDPPNNDQFLPPLMTAHKNILKYETDNANSEFGDGFLEPGPGEVPIARYGDTGVITQKPDGTLVVYMKTATHGTKQESKATYDQYMKAGWEPWNAPDTGETDAPQVGTIDLGPGYSNIPAGAKPVLQTKMAGDSTVMVQHADGTFWYYANDGHKEKSTYTDIDFLMEMSDDWELYQGKSSMGKQVGDMVDASVPGELTSALDKWITNFEDQVLKDDDFIEFNDGSSLRFHITVKDDGSKDLTYSFHNKDNEITKNWNADLVSQHVLQDGIIEELVKAQEQSDAESAIPVAVSLEDLRSDIPPNIGQVKKLFPNMTDQQAKMYRNAWFAMGDAIKLDKDNPGYKKALDKAEYNLGQAGPDGQSKLAQLKNWRNEQEYGGSGGNAPISLDPNAAVPNGTTTKIGSSDYTKLPDGKWQNDTLGYVYAPGEGTGDWEYLESWAKAHPTSTLSPPAQPAKPSYIGDDGFAKPGTKVEIGDTHYEKLDNGTWLNPVTEDVYEKDAIDDNFEFLEALVKNKPDKVIPPPAAPATPTVGGDPSVPAGTKVRYKKKVYVKQQDGSWQSGTDSFPVADEASFEMSKVASSPPAPPKGTWLKDSLGDEMYVGDLVISDTDGLSGYITGFESNGTGVKVKGLDGKTRARKAIKMHLANPPTKLISKPGATSQASTPAVPKVAKVAPKPTAEVDVNSPYYGKPKPDAPTEDPALKEDFVSPEWIKQAEDLYLASADKASPTLQQSSHTWGQMNDVRENGTLVTLNKLLNRKRITPEMHAEALKNIDEIKAKNEKLQAAHQVKLKQYVEDLSAWKKANGIDESKFPGAPANSTEEFTGGEADWNKGPLGTPTGVDAFNALKNGDADIAIRGVSVATDGDQIEDLDVRLLRVIDEFGVERIEAKFKLTAWAGDALLPHIDSISLPEKGTRLRDRKIDPTTGLPKYMSSNKTTLTGTTYTFNDEDNDTRVEFARTSSSGLTQLNSGITHNSVRMFMPADATPETMQAVLTKMGLANARPATPQDVRKAAINRLTNLVGRTDGTKQMSDADREFALQHLEHKFGITEDSIRVSTSHTGRIKFYLDDDARDRVIKETNMAGIQHNVSDSHNVGKWVQMLSGPLSGLQATGVRWSEGLGGNGSSSGSDIMGAGGDWIFTKMLHSHSGKASGGGKIVMHPKAMARRIDMYVNQSDNGSGKHYNGSDPYQQMKGDPYEVQWKHGIPLNEMWYATAPSAQVRQAIIDKLLERGITDINGIPVDQFVLITGMTTPTIDPSWHTTMDLPTI